VRVPISWVPFSLAHMYRSTSDDAPPVEVCDLGNGFWRVLDGRHRYLASVIAGRPDLLAELEAATPKT
jgi:hypothetical protein